MKITIAGANSFIGKRMLKLLASEGVHEVTAIVREESKNRAVIEQYPNIHIVDCNMENYASLGEKCSTGDVFINYAWKGSRGATRMDHEMQKFDYECTMASFRSMAEAGYKTLVSAGSQAEYGQIEDVITEDTIPQPNTEYGKYKLKIYEDSTVLCKDYGIRFIEPRYFSLYGPGDYEKTLIMSCISKMMNGEDVVLNPCTQLWDYMYVDDACTGLLKLIENNVSAGAYDFATGIHCPLRDFVLDIKRALNSSSHVEFDDPAHYTGLYIDIKPIISKLVEAIGWVPETTFIEGIKQTAGLK